MKTATLVKILLAVSFVWFVLALPTWWNFHVIDRHADGYRTAWMMVTASHCGIDGNGDACLLQGTIDGTEVSLATTASKGKSSVQGAEGVEVKVLYNPQIPESGLQGQRLQVLDWTDDIRAEGRRFRFFVVALSVSSLLLILAVHILFLFGARRRTGIGDEILEADLGGAKPVAGVPLLGLGLTFVLWQIPQFTWAGLILGSVMTVLGALLLRSRRLRATPLDDKTR